MKAPSLTHQVIASLLILVAVPLGLAHVQKESVSLGATVAAKPFAIPVPDGGKDYYPLLSPPKSKTMRSGKVNLMPGKRAGWHSTEGFEEVLVVFSGRGHLETKGLGSVSVEPGKMIYVPPHTEHDVVNDGKSKLEYIYIVARSQAAPTKQAAR